MDHPSAHTQPAVVSGTKCNQACLDVANLKLMGIQRQLLRTQESTVISRVLWNLEANAVLNLQNSM